MKGSFIPTMNDNILRGFWVFWKPNQNKNLKKTEKLKKENLLLRSNNKEERKKKKKRIENLLKINLKRTKS